MSQFRYIRFFSEIKIEDIPLVGGKNASLGEMYQELTPKGVPVPNGFAITAEAYRALLDANNLWPTLHDLLDNLNPDDVADLKARGKKSRDAIYFATLPEEVVQEMLEAYHQLQQQYGEEISVAVRSSATAEDLPNASFAGQQDTYLNIKGDAAYIDACKRCFASLFTDRAIHYRIDQGFDHFKVALSIGVQLMVRSDLASSGVMFSLDTETGFKDTVFITAAYGLGENVVQGAVDPDEFYVHKPTFKKGYRAVLRRHLGSKKIKMVLADDNTREPVRNIPTPKADQARFCISDEEVLKLAEYAIKIEEHYSAKAGYEKPMDMEWAKDGLSGELFVVQARPETVASQKKGTVLQQYVIDERPEAVLASGRAVGGKVANGVAHIIESAALLDTFKEGEVLVADTTTPDWEPVMKKASAIVTNRGGRTCHAAIVARELGIPAIVGCGDATETIQTGQTVGVSCAEGDTGLVYDGPVKFHIEETDLSNLAKPKTEVMMNVGNPDTAFQTSFIPNDGVGLARMEFIINESIKVHPKAFLHPEALSDKARQKVEALTANYESGAHYFIEKLSEGVGTIAAAFYPKPVVVRMSDFKSNEYASLIGGKAFEPKEANPMLGFRGAARYIDPDYQDAFGLECRAMKRVREEMGLENVILMIPFCRRVPEAEAVIKVLAEFGLKRGEQALQVYMMCEIPNNVLQIDAFSEHFDGFSIGTNDLTQLTLGVDRDSEKVAMDYDERDPGVLKMVQMAIEGAHRHDKHISLCGQAPSDFPEFAEFLVQQGIDAISLNPDSVLKTLPVILQAEEKR
jgi:pyruvate,water dikinase